MDGTQAMLNLCSVKFSELEEFIYQIPYVRMSEGRGLYEVEDPNNLHSLREKV
jgi:hypothetical protein